MGITLPPAEEPDDHGIWEWHVPAWNAWCVISGQWRCVSVATMERAKLIWLGIDYAAAAAGLALAGVQITPEIWADVRQIEAGAVKELNG